MKKIFLAWLLIFSSLITIILIDIYDKGGSGEQISSLTLGLQIFGVMSIFVFWIWMFSDFFKRDNLKHKVLWGWTLLIANWLAAVIYFLFIYFPREKKKIKNESF